MRAILFDGHPESKRQLRLAVNHPDPQPPLGEVRIRTILAGICNTDLEVVRGYAVYSGVLGHEFVGVVDQAQDPSLVGQRVVGEINAPCGKCDTCHDGRPTHCPQRTALGIRGRDGTLAEYFCLPVGGVNTELVREARPDLDSSVLMQPEDIADTVLYLLELPERAIVDQICIRRSKSTPF